MDIPWETSRGAAAAATWIFRGDETRRGRGRAVDSQRRRVAATPRPPRVEFVSTQVTPAWECFDGEGCRHVNVPLDLTNPATLDFQVDEAAAPAAAAGYTAMALDNFNLKNSWSACGAFRNGSWVQLYDADDPKSDPKYGEDVLDWIERAAPRFRAVGLLTIPNWSPADVDADTRRVAAAVDGFLCERGFAEWNPIPNTSSYDTPPPMTTAKRFAGQVAVARYLQLAGKAYRDPGGSQSRSRRRRGRDIPRLRRSYRRSPSGTSRSTSGARVPTTASIPQGFRRILPAMCVSSWQPRR